MSQPHDSAHRPRVLHCITRLGLGGAENIAFEIIRRLQNQIEPALFTVRPSDPDEVGHGLISEVKTLGLPWFPGTRLTMKQGGMVPGGMALARAMRKWRPDVVHYHAEPSEACGAITQLMPGRISSTPALRTVHNSKYWSFWPRIGAWTDRRLRATSAVAVSASAQAAFQMLRQSSGAGSAKCEIIYNGVAMPIRTPRTGPRNPRVMRVIFAGRFAPEKGLDLLCQALPQTVLPAGTRGEITFVGGGPASHLPSALKDSAPRGWQVSILPPTPRLASLMDEHDVAVIPSRFEGLGLVAIEAIRRGLTVVATSAAGLREVFPADYPYLASPESPASLAEALSRAFAQPAQWAAATASAQEFGRVRFDPDLMAAAYLRVYRKLAARA